jgi:hypothetical protein
VSPRAACSAQELVVVVAVVVVRVVVVIEVVVVRVVVQVVVVVHVIPRSCWPVARIAAVRGGSAVPPRGKKSRSDLLA